MTDFDLRDALVETLKIIKSHQQQLYELTVYGAALAELAHDNPVFAPRYEKAVGAKESELFENNCQVLSSIEQLIQKLKT